MVRIVLKTKESNIDEPILWNNIFPYCTVPIFVGKKRKHVMDLISALELRGVSTTSELAHFVIESHYPKGLIKTMGKSVVKRRGHYYWNHLYGFAKKTIAGKKNVGTYDGLLEKGYVKIIDMPKTNIGTYFPTLLGHLVSLGYEYVDDAHHDDDEKILSFIKNASTNSLYFAFLYDIVNKISLDFVKELFLDPIKKMIRQHRIRFDDDYTLNFDIIASATALKIREIIQKSWTAVYSNEIELDEQALKKLDVLINNTWFDLQPDSKWEGRLIELYYPTKEQRMFYSQHSDFSDKNLIYKVMREIHVNYYGSYETKIHKKYQQKFPIPIRRNRKKKIKSSKFPDREIVYDFLKE